MTGSAADIIIVTGLPRSGTSMLMQMLHAGGIAVLTDDHRPADISNPKGYFEYEPTKSIGSERSWLDGAAGSAIKVVVPLLLGLPPDRAYRVLFSHRTLTSVLRSQDIMLKRRGGEVVGDRDEWLARLAEMEQQARGWCDRAGCATLNLQYEHVVAAPNESCLLVRDFLGRDLDTAAMAASIGRPAR